MRDGKKVVITYGTYDLLHFGHIALLERAKALGDYLIVGVTSDAFDRSRGKLNVAQSLAERLLAIHETGIADEIVVEEYQGQKIADIKKYGVDIFAIGSDWEGKFDYLKRYCDVVYLERTKGVSSTELRANKSGFVSLACIGSGYLMKRFLDESSHVAAVKITGAWSDIEGDHTYDGHNFPVFQSAEEAMRDSDAVYIVSSPLERVSLIEKALDNNCHVLCESPMFMSKDECSRLHEKAKEKNLVLMEALKTLYFPAFQHLQVLLESGIIGDVKDIDASFSHVFDGLNKQDKYQGSFYDMGAYIALPAISLLGDEFVDSSFACRYEDEFCVWAKCTLLYPGASATLRVGRGMKTEGDMTITGSNGYIYVPAPWWKMDYFEVRGEDPRETKRYFYDYAGQGQRYELLEFAGLVLQNPADRVFAWKEKDDFAVSRLMEQFDSGEVAVLASSAYRFGGGERIDDR